MNLMFRVVSLQRGILAAKKALLASFVASIMALPAKAGIPVIDGTNVVQTTISAVNNVQAVAKQIQQYQTQLQQYENMLKNTVAPAAGNHSNLLIVFYVQIMPDDFVMQLHRF